MFWHRHHNQLTVHGKVLPQSHNTKLREHVCLPGKRIFPAIKLRPQTPPIDKRELGDAAIPGERRIHTSSSAPPPPPTKVAHSGRKILHQFFPILL